MSDTDFYNQFGTKHYINDYDFGRELKNSPVYVGTHPDRHEPLLRDPNPGEFQPNEFCLVAHIYSTYENFTHPEGMNGVVIHRDFAQSAAEFFRQRHPGLLFGVYKVSELPYPTERGFR